VHKALLNIKPTASPYGPEQGLVHNALEVRRQLIDARQRKVTEVPCSHLVPHFQTSVIPFFQ
jgi:hypothetical protein